ncbi:hypothetical protein STXM2123_1529 [Streptomyces sp. F-3]|nr:hypothetical protein STXM2123_1529 [Streptomyces sp. F-3]
MVRRTHRRLGRRPRPPRTARTHGTRHPHRLRQVGAGACGERGPAGGVA